jgi:hypothetical protein
MEIGCDCCFFKPKLPWISGHDMLPTPIWIDARMVALPSPSPHFFDDDEYDFTTSIKRGAWSFLQRIFAFLARTILLNFCRQSNIKWWWLCIFQLVEFCLIVGWFLWSVGDWWLVTEVRRGRRSYNLPTRTPRNASPSNMKKSCLVGRSKVLPILHHYWNWETRINVYGLRPKSRQFRNIIFGLLAKNLAGRITRTLALRRLLSSARIS